MVREESAGAQLDESCEGGVDLAFGAGLQDLAFRIRRSCTPFASAAS
jgi:hypothetical protein